jgi:hypothetical protein
MLIEQGAAGTFLWFVSFGAKRNEHPLTLHYANPFLTRHRQDNHIVTLPADDCRAIARNDDVVSYRRQFCLFLKFNQIQVQTNSD